MGGEEAEEEEEEEEEEEKEEEGEILPCSGGICPGRRRDRPDKGDVTEAGGCIDRRCPPPLRVPCPCRALPLFGEVDVGEVAAPTADTTEPADIPPPPTPPLPPLSLSEFALLGVIDSSPSDIHSALRSALRLSSNRKGSPELPPSGLP